MKDKIGFLDNIVPKTRQNTKIPKPKLVQPFCLLHKEQQWQHWHKDHHYKHQHGHKIDHKHQHGHNMDHKHQHGHQMDEHGHIMLWHWRTAVYEQNVNIV